ncbi:MAG: putative metal-binding motif-containing protein [Alphaproteobacteria bacterium]|nr:putative metal-binding motif-containing protein [Alphaproteobacteria bacterium]
MRALSITLLLAAWGCKNPDKEDADNDGFNAAQDCNDNDASINPDAEEVCDGVDNDCDGRADEDLGADYYTDADGDGFGTGNADRQCDVGGGVATVGGDCDDTNVNINPDADEDCDPNVDANCDGDPVAGAADLLTYYIDADLDGFGDATATGTESCDPITNWVTDNTDCDDLDDTVHPGATEICDGKDTDCDKATPEESSVDATTWYTDADGDGVGDTATAVLACEAPPYSSDVGGDCDDADPTSYPGANELCDGGIDNDCDPSTDEALTAVWYRDLDNDGFGNDDDFVNGCSPPAGYVQIGGDCDDTEPAINPNTAPNCRWDHCLLGNTITQDQTWSANPDLTHVVNCALSVQGLGSPTLTIEDGAVVEFGAGASLKVGDTNPGSLIVEGTSAGVTFTSSATVKDFGDWEGVKIGSRDVRSSITGLTVEYGGSQVFGGGLWVNGSDLEISGLNSHHNLGAGLRITGAGAEPLVHDSQLTNNTGNGLLIEISAGLARSPAGGGAGPSFTNNLITDNVGRPVSMPGSHADELSPTSVFSPNDVEEIELITGTLRFTGTWYDHGIPYVVRDNNNISVQDSALTVLTIEDGVTMLFGQTAGLEIGKDSAGKLVIQNGPLGVVFSATDEVIQLSSNWNGILFGANDTGSQFRNALIEYGGARVPDGGNLQVRDSAPEISDATIRLSDTDGIFVTGLSAAPLIHDCFILDNDENGVYVSSSSGVARAVAPTFANNDLSGNLQSPVVFPANFVGELDVSTTFSGNGDRIGIHGGNVIQPYSLWRKLDEDYEVRGTVTVGGPQSPVLEVQDRVAIYFEADTKFRAGTADDGALRILGNNGVLLTSAVSPPGAGDWHGVEIGRNSASGNPIVPPAEVQSELHNVRIEYAGGSDPVPTDQGRGALSLFDRDPNCAVSQEPEVFLENIQIVHSSKAGLAIAQQAVANIDGLHVDDAPDCVDVGGDNPLASCVATVTQFVNSTCTNALDFGTWPIEQTSTLTNAHTNGFVFPGPIAFRDTAVQLDVTLYDLGVPYRVEKDMQVAYISVPTLTVEQNAEVRFRPNVGWTIATSGTRGVINGSFVAKPGSLFTSDNAVPAPNDWDGITFNNMCYVVEIDGATFEYGGANTVGNLYFNRCDWNDAYDAVTATTPSPFHPSTNKIRLNDVQYSGGCGIGFRQSFEPVPDTNTYTGNIGFDVCHLL